MTLAEAKCTTIRIVKLEREMDKLQNSETAWKRTLGCPGSRYLPEWEKLMDRVTAFYAKCTDYEADSLADYEAQLRA